jgi:hypothetical protein
MEQKNKYYSNGHTSKSAIQIQCKSHENYNDIFYRNAKRPKFDENIKTPNTKSNP